MLTTITVIDLVSFVDGKREKVRDERRPRDDHGRREEEAERVLVAKEEDEKLARIFNKRIIEGLFSPGSSFAAYCVMCVDPVCVVLCCVLPWCNYR